MFRYISFLLLIFVAACTSKVNEQTISDSSVTKHIGEEIVLQDAPLLVLNDSTTNFSHTSVPASFVRECLNIMGKEQEANWQLLKFIEIDSLKAAKAYEKYVQDLDIAGIKDASTSIYDTLSYPGGQILVWGLNVRSYEACPYFEGKTIYLTTISREGIFKSTAAVLEISNGGDAPSFNYNWGQCTIGSDLHIACVDSAVTGESEDEYESVETTPRKNTYEITPEGFIKKLDHYEGTVIKQRRKISSEN